MRRKLEDTEREKFRVWVQMALAVSAAVLLAYGVVRVPNRVPPNVIDNSNGSGLAQRAPEVILIPLIHFSDFEGPGRDLQITQTLSLLQQDLKAQPFEFPLDLKVLTPAKGEIGIHGRVAEFFSSRLQNLASAPALILLIGESDSTSVRLEVQAFHEADEKFFPDGPKRYLARMPLHKIQHFLSKNDIPAVISYQIDSSVQNLYFYHLIHLITHEPWNEKLLMAGLIRLPAKTVASLKIPPFEVTPKWNAKTLRFILQAAFADRLKGR